MTTATVTVSFVNPPKGTAKSGTIKTKDGQLYGVWPDKLNQFTPGKTYEIEYTSREVNGKTYHNLAKWKEVAAAPASSPSNGHANGNGGYVKQPTNPIDAERMFVCGAVNAAIEGGRVEPTAVAVAGLVNAMRQVWSETFGAAHDDASPPY